MTIGTSSVPSLFPSHLTAEPLKLTWQHPRGMVRLSIINFCLRVATLGLYNFWGKTEVRSRLWSGVRVNGEPLAYTGSGWELFVGFAVAMLYILVPYGSFFGAQLFFGPASATAIAVTYAFLLVITWMWSVAFYRARRFRLMRTCWRGIRGDLTGSANAFAWTSIWTLLVVSISLGWAYPWRQTKIQRILVENTRFGDKPLTFTGSSGSLYGPYALMWFGGLIGYGVMIAIIVSMTPMSGPRPPTAPPPMALAAIFAGVGVFFLMLWLAGAWYQTRSFNHYAAHTHFDGVKFEGTARASSLLWLGLSNGVLAILPLAVIAALAAVLAIAIGVPLSAPALAKLDSSQTRLMLLAGLLSLGLLGPLLQARRARFWMENLHFDGTLASGPLRQELHAGAAQGEGLAQAFDIDVF
jgi:uncharacterized membrane protein YjgN (DUF898 family)